MKHIPSKPEVVAKTFIYSVLAVGFAFGLMVPFVFWGGAGAAKAVPEKGQLIYSVIESPFFALTLAVFIGIAIYSAIMGVPKWVAVSMKVLAAIAILPITLRMLLEEGKWPFSESNDESNT